MKIKDLPESSARLTIGQRISLAKNDAKDPADKPRGFEMLAYTGDAVKRFGARIVFDMDGMDLSGVPMPSLLQHDSTQIAGKIVKAEKSKEGLKLCGTMSKVTAASKQICELADEDFPWQASVGLDFESRPEFYDEDDSLECNGKTFAGPIYCVRKTRLFESSFVPLGADSGTSSTLLSADEKKGKLNMSDTKDEWKEKLRGLTITEFKAAATQLYEMLRNEVLREERARLSAVATEIGRTGLPSEAQARLSAECMDLDIPAATVRIESVTRIECAFKAAKDAGVNDATLSALRQDLKGVTPSVAVSQIQLAAEKFGKGAATAGKALVTTTDPAINAPEASQKLAAAVKLARDEFKTIKARQPDLTEKQYVKFCLGDVKLEYTPDEFKAVAPDLV